MLLRRQVFNQQKGGANNQKPPKANPKQGALLNFLFFTPYGRWFSGGNICFVA